MIGLNGGLIGKDRSTSTSASLPGVWTPGEQVKAKRSLLWPLNQGEDPYFANVLLLLRADGVNGSTTITDGSIYARTMTAYANAQISTAQSKFGGASLYFDGTGDYVEGPSSSDWVLNTDYCIEFWIYPVGSQALASGIIGTYAGWNSYSGKWQIVMTGSTIYAMTSSGSYGINATLTAATWSHIAWVRNGATTSLYVNGTSVTSTASVDYLNTDPIRLGTGFSVFNGYLDDIRITKGVPRYTANFTPPGAL